MDARRYTYWFLTQLWKGHVDDNDFLNFRCVVNKAPYHDQQTGNLIDNHTESIFNRSYGVAEFRRDFLKEGGIYDRLGILNRLSDVPANVYFAINPRIDPVKNTKPFVKGALALFLDLDISEEYSIEDRLAQIQFWQDCGYGPSIWAYSGHGIQCYWLLDKVYTREEAEPILRRMVEVTGTKGKGNVWDVTRIFRLPGFLNQKYWFRGDSPPCYIGFPSPETIDQMIRDREMLPRRPLEGFQNFPLSRKHEIARYVESAQTMDGEFHANLIRLVSMRGEALRGHQAVEEVERITAAEAPTDARVTAKAARAQFTPTKNILPPDVKAIPWGTGYKSWIPTYCVKGFDGMTPEEKETLKKKAKMTGEMSASELDAKVVWQLVRLGYTFEAVDEFWHRSGLHLHRPDKEARNPEYLAATYDRMLEAYRNALDVKDPVEKAKAGACEDKIQVYEHKTFIVSGDKTTFILNGSMHLKKLFRNVDAEINTQEHLECELRLPGYNGQNGVTKLFPRSAFATVEEFKKHTSGLFVCLAEKAKQLGFLLLYLYEENKMAEKCEYRTRMLYDKGTFVFPKLAITENAITITNTVELNEALRNEFPWHDAFIDYIPEREAAVALLREHWENIKHLHLPRFVCAMLGNIAATAMRQVLTHEKITSTLHLPAINIRGRPVSGKSETAKLLYTLTGCRDTTAAVTSMKSSAFSLDRMLDLVNFLPFLIDEFKEEKGFEKQLEFVRSFVRRQYSGENVLRGKASLGVRGSRSYGSPTILGEAALDRSGNVAEFTRTLPISTEEYIPANHLARFHSLDNVKLYEIGPFFYQHLLTLDLQAAHQRFLQIKTETVEQLAGHFQNERVRIGHNLATMKWGCEIYDSFIHAMCPELTGLCTTFDLNQVFTQYVINECRENEQVISIPATIMNAAGEEVADDNLENAQFVPKDEALDFLTTLSRLAVEKDENLRKKETAGVFTYEIREDRKELWIKFNVCYDLYRQYCMRNNYQYAEARTIKARLTGAKQRRERWLIARCSTVRPINSDPINVCICCLSTLRRMEVWHPRSTKVQQGEL